MIIDKKKAKEVGDDLRKAVMEVAKKHGLYYCPGGASYNTSSFRMRIKVETPDMPEQRLEAQGLFRLGQRVRDPKGYEYIVRDAEGDRVYIECVEDGSRYSIKARALTAVK